MSRCVLTDFEKIMLEAVDLLASHIAAADRADFAATDAARLKRLIKEARETDKKARQASRHG